VLDKHIPLFKRSFIKQYFDSLACREFAFGVLRLDPANTPTQTGGGSFVFKLLKDFLHGVNSEKILESFTDALMMRY